MIANDSAHQAPVRETPIPHDEPTRLQALSEIGILDSAPDAEFDRITQLAAEVFGTQVSAVSFVDRQRLWFKSKHGTDVTETAREVAFCAHTILQNDVMVVLDATQDERFREYRNVTGEPHIRFYAGAPIASRSGHNVGTLCIVDSRPRVAFDEREQAVLRSLANMVSEATEAYRGNDRLRSTGENTRDRYALVSRATLDGVWDWDLLADEVYYSPRWQRILGLEEKVMVASSSHWLERVHSDDLPAVLEEIRKHLAGEISRFRSEHRVCHGDGTWRFVMVRGLAQREASGAYTRMAGSLMDMTHDKTSDALTSLPNRLLLRDRLEQRIQLAVETGTWNFAVMFIDVDRFKKINDRFGHIAGDKVITTVAQRLQDTVAMTRHGRESVVARFAGDEFVILLEGVNTSEEAVGVARRLQASVGLPILWEHEEVVPGVSIGIAMASPDYQSPETFLQNADIAMYRAKAEGRSTSILFVPRMQSETLERFQLESDLRSALARKQLSVVYQPQIDLVTGNLLGCEALARWEHPVHGSVSPAYFIPIAEEIGVIAEIDHWVLRTACAQLAEWRKLPRIGANLRVSVNLSSHQLSLKNIHQRIQDVLADFYLPASALCLEVTETVLMNDVDTGIEILRSLRALGVGLHMDDFGSGYSSFKHLYQLPFDTLKIDRSFITHILADKDARKIVKAILNLAETLHLDIIAEGIEEPAQAILLYEMGCTVGQGYYFSRPVDPMTFRDRFLTAARSQEKPTPVNLPRRLPTLVRKPSNNKVPSDSPHGRSRSQKVV